MELFIFYVVMDIFMRYIRALKPSFFPKKNHNDLRVRVHVRVREATTEGHSAPHVIESFALTQNQKF